MEGLRLADILAQKVERREDMAFGDGFSSARRAGCGLIRALIDGGEMFATEGK